MKKSVPKHKSEDPLQAKFRNKLGLKNEIDNERFEMKEQLAQPNRS